MSDILIPKKKKIITGCDSSGTKFIYDLDTTNISFLQTAADLKKVGVENNMFFLALYDKSLLGVDPFSQGLSRDMIERISLECIRNPWYFLRECVRIPEQGGAVGPGSGSPFILHRGNLAASYCFFNNVDFYLVIPRQCFKTWSTLALILWAFLFGTTNSSITFVNKKQKDADRNLKNFKAAKAALPIFMQQKYKIVESEYEPDVKKIDKGIDNIRTMENPITHNVIESMPSAGSEEAADGIGRGYTSPVQFYDEVEFTKWIGTILKASAPAYLRAQETAEKNGAIHCRMLITTPGNIDSQPVMESQATRDNCGQFTEKIYDIPVKEFREGYMEANSRNGMMYIEFNYKQIGMDQKWYKKVCELLEWDKIKIKREILLQRIRGTTDSPFDPEDLEQINDYRKEPIKEIVLRKLFLFYIYEEIDRDTPYLIGVDCATGRNEDSTAIVCVDPYTLHPVACLKTPLMGAVQTTQVIGDIINKYMPRGVLCIEDNHTGSAIVDMIRNSPIAGNLYYDIDKMLTPSTVSKLDDKRMVEVEAENRRYWAIQTTGTSREAMMSILLIRAHENRDAFVCRELIDELNSLIKKSNGKIEAAPGSHDDVVMAYLMAMYVYHHGTKLARYGIVRGMNKNPKIDPNRKPEDNYAEIYAQLPDDLKSIFPAPTPVVQHQGVAAGQAPIPETVLEEMHRPSSEDDIYKKIQEMQAQRKVTTSDGMNVLIQNTYQNEMFTEENASRRGGSIDDDVFDICDLLNN